MKNASVLRKSKKKDHTCWWNLPYWRIIDILPKMCTEKHILPLDPDLGLVTPEQEHTQISDNQHFYIQL